MTRDISSAAFEWTPHAPSAEAIAFGRGGARAASDSDVQYIDLRELEERTVQFLARYDISAHACIGIWKRSAFPRYGDLAAECELESAVYRSFQVSRPAYLDDLFGRGHFVVSDIFRGTENLSTHSFLLDRYHIAYRFSSLEPYYVVVRRWRGHVAAIMIPRLKLAIGFASPEGGDPAPWNRALFVVFLKQVTANYNAVRTLLSSATEALGVLLGHESNLGHFFWTDLAGMADILERYGKDRIRHIITGPHVPVAVGSVFPELTGIPTVQGIGSERLFEVGLRDNVQYVSPIGVRISADLRGRISRAVNKSVDIAWLARLRAKVADQFVFWINLRSHNKTWVRQRAGYSYIVRQLHAAIGTDLLVVLDGWVDTREEADKLTSEISRLCEVVDTIGCPFAESFVWAEHSHLFCSVIGSGLVINTWLTGKPGVAHANSAHMPQSEAWKHVGDDIARVEFVHPTKDFGDKLYSNYDVDETDIVQKLLGLVREYYPNMLVSTTTGVGVL